MLYDFHNNCYPYNKLGGNSYFQHVFDSGIHESAKKMLDIGWEYLLQLSFPVGPNDADVEGDWPFGEYVLI